MKYRAFDTETIKGKAYVLSWDSGAEIVKNLDDIFDLLKKLGKYLVVYNLDYDAMAILKHTTPECLKMLYLDGAVHWREYRFSYIKGKYLKIAKNRDVLHIFDLMPFFQTSLDKAAEKYLNKRKKEIDKKLLSNLTEKTVENNWKLIKEYAIQDAKITQELADKLIDAITEIGLEEKKLFSPGYMAKKYLEKNGISPIQLDYEYRAIAEKAYFGGRIEVWRRGKIDKVFIYDLKSAYPAIFAELPDLSQARIWWSEKPESSRWYIAEAEIDCDTPILPHRDGHGLIRFPVYRRSVAVFTNYEGEILQKAGAEIRWRRVLNIESMRDGVYRELVTDLFEKRKESGLKGLVYKLILNSLYGIFAEKRSDYRPMRDDRAYRELMIMALREGLETFFSRYMVCENGQFDWWNCRCFSCKRRREVLRRFRKYKRSRILLGADGRFYEKVEYPGKWQNLILAALVTSGTRARIAEIILEYPNDFVAAFTDSVILKKPLPQKKVGSGKLGSWNFEYCGSIVLVGAGVYQTEKTVKSRGFKGIGDLTERLKNEPDAIVEFMQKDRISLGQIVNWGMEEVFLNIIREKPRELDVNFDDKRVWLRDFQSAKEILLEEIESVPYILEKNRLKLPEIK